MAIQLRMTLVRRRRDKRVDKLEGTPHYHKDEDLEQTKALLQRVLDINRWKCTLCTYSKLAPNLKLEIWGHWVIGENLW